MLRWISPKTQRYRVLGGALAARDADQAPQSLLQIDNPEIAFMPDVLPWASEQAVAWDQVVKDQLGGRRSASLA